MNNIEELADLLQATYEKLSRDTSVSAEATTLFGTASKVITALTNERVKLKAELNAYRDALIRISNEDFRGNRPAGAVEAYQVLMQFKGGNKQ